MSRTQSTITIDATLAAELGFRNAVVFEKVWWLIHKSEQSIAEMSGEKWWSKFSYDRLYTFFKAKSGKNYIGSVRTLRRAIDELVAIGLLLRKQAGDGVRLAINFDGLKTLVENISRYLITPPVSPKVDNLNTDESVQMWTVTMSESGQADSPEVDTLYIYESDSFNDSFNEEKTPSAVADAPSVEPEKVEEVIIDKPHEAMWGCWAELTYAKGRTFSNSERGLIGNAVKTVVARYGEKQVLEALTTGRFQAWLILRDDWYVQGKIQRPNQLLRSFDLMMTYEKQNGRDWWNRFTSVNPPEWKSEVETHCSAFAEKARQAMPEMVSNARRGLADWQKPDPQGVYSLDGTFDPTQETVNPVFQKRAKEYLQNGNKS